MKTPYFLIDEKSLIRNLEITKRLKELSGVKVVLALKCFSTWGVFDTIKPYLDGTTSSGPYEVKLGAETFGKETHAYSVGFSREDIEEVNKYCNKLIFNSISQLNNLKAYVKPDISIGLRINPGISFANQDLADPARLYSRLGVHINSIDEELLEDIHGLMFHMNCENKSVTSYSKILSTISNNYFKYLNKVEWVSLGGGLFYTWPNYDVEAVAKVLKEFSEKHNVQIYLEPGEAIVTKTTDLVVTVLDIIENEKKTAIVDSATEAHRLDTLIYNEPATILEADDKGSFSYIIGSCSCLAGDQFCETTFNRELQVGDKLHIMDSGGYTMVKLNWFNGLKMPSIYFKKSDNSIIPLNTFSYNDFKDTLTRV